VPGPFRVPRSPRQLPPAKPRCSISTLIFPLVVCLGSARLRRRRAITLLVSRWPRGLWHVRRQTSRYRNIPARSHCR
jgi:hypothetical protein